MAKNKFIHLHVHSDYTLLNGMCKINEIARVAEENNMTAVALTDYGNMGGVIEFYTQMKRHGIKPIIGCEFPVFPESNIILLCKDYSGYRNLCKIISRKEGQITNQILSEYSDGLIALSGLNIEESKHDAESSLKELLEIFGQDNLYLALTGHGQENRNKINRELVALGKKFNIKPVATNDVRFLKKEDYNGFKILQCLKKNITLKDYISAPSMEQHYFKTADEMAAIFADIPDSITNTLEVAEKCNLEIPLVPEISRYPVYEIPFDTSHKEYLRNLCIKGIKERYGFNGVTGKGAFNEREQEIIDNIDYELNVINNSNYCSYFLILWDIVQYAKEKNIPVSPGRGSVGGSIICYLLGITDIDPLRYDLVFERFFNPELIIPPDIDLDVCGTRRNEILDYIFNKYGKERTAYISTYSAFRGRLLVKSIIKVMGRKPSDWLMIAENITESNNCRDINSIIEENPELKDMIKCKKWVREIYDYALCIEGVNRDSEIHSAGIIIGEDRLDEIVPLYKDQDKGSIAQYTAHECEENGLMPLDILGLRTLSVIQETVNKIRINKKDFLIDKIPVDDKKTFALLNRGDTSGVFQFESQKMQELCPKLGIESIEDIIAIIALYRPGLMQFIPEFIARKKGEIAIEYEVSQMVPILQETYGLILYQEQVIKLLQVIAGFSLGEADLCRRTLGKKKKRDIEAVYEKYMKGCKANRIDHKTADAIWKNLLLFSGYGYNKSHSVAYSLIAYRTAFLKANYNNEFIAISKQNAINR